MTRVLSPNYTHIRTPVEELEARVRSPWAGRKDEEGLKAEAEAAMAATSAKRSMVRRPILTSHNEIRTINVGRAKGYKRRPLNLDRVNPPAARLYPMSDHEAKLESALLPFSYLEVGYGTCAESMSPSRRSFGRN